MKKRLTQIVLSACFASLAIAALFLRPESAPQPVLAQAQVTPAADFRRTVSVNGSGLARAVPDIAIISIGVQTQAATAAQALTANNQQMDKLMTTLRSAGIAPADIQTQAIQLFPQSGPQPTPLANQQGNSTAVPTTYTALNSVEVTVRTIANVGTLLDQVVSAGGNVIQNIRFDVSNPGQDLDAARKAAYAEAFRKAGQLADLSGLKLGPVVSISENSSIPVPAQDITAIRMEQAQPAVPISPGIQTYTVDLQITFELQ
jgi:uncharacterized protein